MTFSMVSEINVMSPPLTLFPDLRVFFTLFYSGFQIIIQMNIIFA
jgi:hypothetical protein